MNSKLSNSGKHGKIWLFSPKPAVFCDGWEELAQAVIVQAVEDYRRALKGLNRNPVNPRLLKRKQECDQFFRSEWFTVLTDADPEKIIHWMQREMNI